METDAGRKTQAEQEADHERRVQHVVKNWNLYKLDAYPWPNADDDAKGNKKRAIVMEMKSKGLYSQSTNWFDVNIDRIIEDAKKARG